MARSGWLNTNAPGFFISRRDHTFQKMCRFVCLTILLFASSQSYGNLAGRLEHLSRLDTTCTAWIVFTDKAHLPPVKHRVSPKALARRRRAGHPPYTAADAPVSPEHVAAIVRRGATLRQTFKWANAASFSLHASLLRSLDSLAFVKHIVPVGRMDLPLSHSNALAKPQLPNADTTYGRSLTHLSMVGVPDAHVYVSDSLSSTPGQGILIGVFDTGFRLAHRCFDFLNSNSAVVADSDFVDGDGDVTHSDSHGSQVLALIGGYDSGEFMGVAWGAQFVLARTEEVAYERHIEEDNWVAALVWAESLGVDIVTSSLGYRYDFTDSDTDYVFAALDGSTTTISSMATEYATQRGVTIVNSMGNEGNRSYDGFGTLNTPADAQGLISVGAVNSYESITSFSSRGPTADGRRKPEVVAMGESVPIPDLSTGNAYTTGGGTSLAAPVVAGVCALVAQTHPGQPADAIRNYLLASCRFPVGQDSVDNTFGYGIPNAGLACAMQPNHVCIYVRDTSKVVLPGVSVQTASRGVLGITDNAGVCVVAADTTSLPVTLLIGSSSLGVSVQAIFTTTPAGTTITLHPPSPSDFLFSLSPNVLSISNISQGLLYEVIVSEGTRLSKGDYLTVSIRTVGGELLWSQTEEFADVAQEAGRVAKTWHPYSSHSTAPRLIPGTYVFLMSYGGTTHSRKFLLYP